MTIFGKILSSTSTYLKFGAEARSRAKQARFVDAYDRRKNDDVTGAMAFNDPISSTN